MKIKKGKAWKILNSRGEWTVEVMVETDKGVFFDSFPSGASKGEKEAVSVDVERAVRTLNEVVFLKLKEKEIKSQKEIDEWLIALDGTENKSNLGVNVIMPVSVVFARALAQTEGLKLWEYISSLTQFKSFTLPKPAFNLINGGVHGSTLLDFQEFMIVPQKQTIKESLEIASEVYQKLKKVLGKNVGDEGGFTPSFTSPERALQTLVQFSPEGTKIIIDCAANQFYTHNQYKMKFGVFTAEGLSRYYQNLIDKYPIIGLEDPFAEKDLNAWKNFQPGICIIGDDLTTTNPQRIKKAKEENLCNGVVIKINQIGTLTEAIQSVNLAKSYGWKIVVSHRSGETNDDFISYFAVGVGADFIKAGAPARGERVAKYNRLLKIEEEIFKK